MCPVSIVAPSENAEVIKYTSVSGFVFLNPVSGYLQLAH